MKTITVELGQRSYPIHIGAGLLDEHALVAAAITARQIMIVSNAVVAPLYLSRLEASLADREIETLVLPDGEAHKTLASFAAIIDAMLEARFHRDACLVALGGGVVGDVAGFAAASYQRGIDFIQVPTTILAQVDSSVGGKTAVNHPRAKNMIGAFHQPIAVLTDLDTLGTLPSRELAAGLAEVIKYGLIEDAAFLEWLEAHLHELLGQNAGALEHAIGRSCEIKAAIVAEDERERGRRALLNLGHTFGHALEAIGRYEQWLHGEAVAIGTMMAARTSEALGFVSPSDCDRIEALLTGAGLPVTAPGIDTADMLERMQLDKKAGRDGLRLVLLQSLGKAVVAPAPEPSILEAAIERQTGG